MTGKTAGEAAKVLRSTPGIAYAAPDYYVSTFATDPAPLPGWVSSAAGQVARHAPAAPVTAGGSPPSPSAQSQPAAVLPDNYGLQSSLQSYLNAAVST